MPPLATVTSSTVTGALTETVWPLSTLIAPSAEVGVAVAGLQVLPPSAEASQVVVAFQSPEATERYWTGRLIVHCAYSVMFAAMAKVAAGA